MKNSKPKTNSLNPKNYKPKTNFWFTLVELIVVITILAILGTIWFVSFNSYFWTARDSVRITDINNIYSQLNMIWWTEWAMPLPDDRINITSSGEVIAYQWYAWENVLANIKVDKWWKDPGLNTYYTYYLQSGRKSAQIMAYFEEEDVSRLSYLEDENNPYKIAKLKDDFLKNYNSNNSSIKLAEYNQTNSSLSLRNKTQSNSSPKLGEARWGNNLEINNPIIPQANASDLSKYKVWVVGKRLGIFVDANTKQPSQDAKQNIEILTGTTIYNVYVSNNIVLSWSSTDLLIANLDSLIRKRWDFSDPSDCPNWFISVPGNKEFNQPGFCVAKYEMSYAWLTKWDNTWWNTYPYNSSLTSVSAVGNSPVVNITQQQAIESCKKMWDWFHLITNSEWMTIARNIESQQVNWSSGSIGNWFIYNWVSEDITKWCDGNSSNSPTSTSRATTTWWGDNINLSSTRASCSDRRQLMLSNWEIIWDFAGNVWEHVNKANTLDWSNYSMWTNGIDFKTPKVDMCNTIDWFYAWSTCNARAISLYWPSNSSWTSTNWVSWIWDYDGNIFLRGANAGDGVNTGIFALHLSRSTTDQDGNVGFRCAK